MFPLSVPCRGLLALFACWLMAVARPACAEPLNVLLLMADDLREEGGVFTRDLVKTPNLDRLRDRGIRFERAYVQYPVCNPSRTSMLTGLRAEETQVVDNNLRMRVAMPSIVTLPQLCREHGWHTASFGKILHLGGGQDAAARRLWTDQEKSWDVCQTFEATAAGKQLIEQRNVTDGALKWCSWGIAAGSDSDQMDGQVADAAIALVEKLGNEPWFIGCGFHKPHDPFVAPQKYFELYPLDSLPVWTDPPDTTPAYPQSVGFGSYGKAFASFSDREWRELLRAYCAGTSFMDAQLGRVLDVLDRRQLWDKTVVIFVGDHGYHTGERRWWNKNTLFERSCRAPLIVAAPDVIGGKSSRSLVEFIDLYPTIVDYCQLKAPHPLPGKSLRPILLDPATSTKEAAYTLVAREAKAYGQAVRTDRWRMIQWSDNSIELYDHRTDPEETRDVASSHPDVVAELKEKLMSLPPFRR